MLGKVLTVTAQSYLYGLSGVVTATENGVITLRILVDEPNTGNLVAGEVEIQVFSNQIKPASTEIVARYRAGRST